MPSIRVAIYARVSTERQVKEGDSIQAQLKALQEYINGNEDYLLVGEYVDNGISGQKSEERDNLQRLLNDIENDRIDLVLFTKLDRWFRSMRHYVNTQAILDEHKTAWKAIWENYDTTTPQGRLIISQMLSIAQFEAENTTQRINAVFDFKVQRGEVLSGKQPMGFDIIDKKLVPNQDAPAILKAFEVYASTGKLTKAISIFESMTGREIKTIKNFTLLLKNEKYMGKFRGNTDYCTPIVSKELFENVQRILDARPSHQRYHDHIFSGLLYCAECGKKMSVCKYLRQIKHGSYYVTQYYCNEHKKRHGTCSNKSTIVENKLEEYLLDTIKGEVTYIFGEKQDDSDKIKSDEIQREIQNTQQKLKRLKDLYIIGDFDISDYISKKSVLENELKVLEDELKESKSVLPNEYAEAILIGNPRMIYDALESNEEKKIFWANLIKRIWMNKDREFKIELN